MRLRRLGCLVGQEGGQRPLDDPRRQVEHDEDGGSEEDERDAEPAEVSRDGEVDHLLDRVEVRVVEVAEEPEDAGAQNLPEQTI